MHALTKPVDFAAPTDYLERERAADSRSEYVNGEIVAVAGGTSNHDIIAGYTYARLHGQLAGRPCRVYSANMKIRIERANVFRYPDVSALCGPVAFYDRERDAYMNPSFICEVLSPSTEAYDRGDRFALYRLIDSFVEYLLVSQDRCWAQLFRRSNAGGWECQEFTEPAEAIRSRRSTARCGWLTFTRKWICEPARVHGLNEYQYTPSSIFS
jgi:Uma2 family endonuclease